MRALISVSDKTGIVEFATKLNELGIEIVSTGGTYNKLKEAGSFVLAIIKKVELDTTAHLGINITFPPLLCTNFISVCSSSELSLLF